MMVLFLVQLCWLIWFIVGVTLDVGRLSVACVFIGKILIFTTEVIWYTPIYERMLRRSWVDDFSGVTNQGGAGWHAWELSLSYPSLLLGIKRLLLGLVAFIIFLTLTLASVLSSWGSWASAIIMFEVMVRGCAYIMWVYGMKTNRVRNWVDRLDIWWRHVLSPWLDSLRTAHVTRSQNRENYEEELDVNPDIYVWG